MKMITKRKKMDVKKQINKKEIMKIKNSKCKMKDKNEMKNEKN